MRTLCSGVLVLLTACVGTGKLEDPPEAAAAPAAAETIAGAVVRDPAVLDHPRARIPADAKSRNFNVTLTADDPGRALVKARALVEELGAEIVGVSVSPEYANLNARLPNERCAELPARVAALQYPTVSENLSVGELRPNVQWIEERLGRIERADHELGRILRGVADEPTADGLLILRELAANERRNLESQLQSYAEQAKFCQVYVNFQATAPAG